MNLAKKVALVTGSSRGIGKGIALGVARYGADVAVNYFQDEQAATEVADEIRAMGRQSTIVQANVEKPHDAARLLETAEDQLGPIDILVNNVGDFFFKPLGSMDHTEWQHVVESNLSSVFYTCQAALPGMRKRRFGRIINIGLSPNYMVRGAPNVAAYSIAKTGVIIFTRSLAVEEAACGITVNCVSPGLIDNGHLPPDQQKWMEQRVPMGRLGRPEEIADAVAFLASDHAQYVSGANLSVCGAWDWQDRPRDHDQIVQELFVGDAEGSSS